MYRGVSLYEGTQHTDGSDLLDAVDAWKLQSGRYPRFVPIWNPFSKAGQAPAGGEFPDADVLSGLRARSVEPMIYMTSISNADSDESWGFQSYWEGDHDDALETWAAGAASYGGRLIVRWDHEMGSNWAPWGAQEPWKYKRAFDHVQETIQGVASNVKMYYCPNSNLRHIRQYCPTAPDFVGFDMYSRRDAQMNIMDQWRTRIDACKKLGKGPIIVGEFGRDDDLARRARWLRTLDGVRGVWAVNYFDMNLPDPDPEDGKEADDWRMTKYMRQVYMQTR